MVETLRIYDTPPLLLHVEMRAPLDNLHGHANRNLALQVIGLGGRLAEQGGQLHTHAALLRRTLIDLAIFPQSMVRLYPMPDTGLLVYIW
jgi:hypothetical protein